jgi:hypothetical protein
MTRQKGPSFSGVQRVVLLVLVLPIVLPLVVASLGLYFLYRIVLYVLVWLLWVARGKDVLLVYSDSPIWHEYMTTQILPLVRERAVILNWSERHRWSGWSLPILVFHCFAGSRDFNPLVMLFRPFRRAKIFRFWSAFKDLKRGHTEPVERVRQDLFLAL